MTQHADSLPADLLLRGAPVYRDGRWDGDCLAIGGGRVLARGSYDDVDGVVSKTTRVESLEGQWLLPAFHDSMSSPSTGTCWPSIPRSLRMST